MCTSEGAGCYFVPYSGDSSHIRDKAASAIQQPDNQIQSDSLLDNSGFFFSVRYIRSFLACFDLIRQFFMALFIYCFLFWPVSFSNIHLFLFLIWHWNIWPALSCFLFDLVISCLPFKFSHLTRQFPACPVLFLIWHGNICPGMSCFIFHLVISRLSYLVFNYPYLVQSLSGTPTLEARDRTQS